MKKFLMVISVVSVTMVATTNISNSCTVSSDPAKNNGHSRIDETGACHCYPAGVGPACYGGESSVRRQIQQ